MFRSILMFVACCVISAADEHKATAKYDIRRCSPKVVKKSPMPRGSKPFRKAGEEPSKFPPIISYEILESGEVRNARVKRSSGFSGIDEYVLNWVQSRRYNSRPGCGVIETEEAVTIDWTAN